MTPYDITRMAREAGWKDLPTVRLAFAGFNLERFAAQAYAAGAAAERERLAKAIDHQRRAMSDHFEVTWLRELAAAIRAKEKNDV